MTDLTDDPSMTDEVDALRLENIQLRAALTSRPEIEQAKGVLMALHSCNAAEAFQMLVHESQTKNIKLHEVAASLLERLRD